MRYNLRLYFKTFHCRVQFKLCCWIKKLKKNHNAVLKNTTYMHKLSNIENISIDCVYNLLHKHFHMKNGQYYGYCICQQSIRNVLKWTFLKGASRYFNAIELNFFIAWSLLAKQGFSTTAVQTVGKVLQRKKTFGAKKKDLQRLHHLEK